VKALLGDYPVTRLFKQQSGFDFADVKLPQQAFKRVVRDLEFDFAELALVTYLLAKAQDKPYRLLPVVLTARFQHSFLVGLADRKIDFTKLRRIGQRSYSVTTATWVRGILADDYGVDLGSIRWVTFEEPHVAEFRDPPNVERAAPGKDMTQMLLAGELDAAIVGEVPKEARIQPLINDLDAAAAAWRRRTGASIQINHMAVVRSAMDASSSSRILDLLKKSREAAGNPPTHPFGIEDNRRNLQAAIDCVHRQHMIPRRFTVEELFQ
jgi:4,5-dihydroxyphthalate decarboxylase